MQIHELTKKECLEALTHLQFGRLGCAQDNQPYIVPVYFAYHDRHLYSVAQLGQKIAWMRANPLVSVEADEIIDHYHWTSVIVQGRYEELLDTPERRERKLAHELLRERPLWWQPALVPTGAHVVAPTESLPVYYRIHIDQVSGRRAQPNSVEAVALRDRARTPRSAGWLKRALRRMGFVGPTTHLSESSVCQAADSARSPSSPRASPSPEFTARRRHCAGPGRSRTGQVAELVAHDLGLVPLHMP
jgi:nitroimidazol reductase NimA-like FMN-containing flavoprotein (pyridoxamine 5'-phosphate oxidase superfamily)